MNVAKIRVFVFKGKEFCYNSTKHLNSFFVEIKFGKEKFDTSIRKDVNSVIEWNEQCDFVVTDTIHDVVITIYKADEKARADVYGKVRIEKSLFKNSEIEKNNWYNIERKFSKKKLGFLEVKIIVDNFCRSLSTESNSLLSLKNVSEMNKKRNNSLTLPLNQMKSKFSNSLISIDSFEKTHSKLIAFKKFASKFKHEKKSKLQDEEITSVANFADYPKTSNDDDSLKLDSLTTSRSSLNNFEIPVDNEISVQNTTNANYLNNFNKIEEEIYAKNYNENFNEDLALKITELQKVIQKKNEKIQDLENYIDNLLLRVMETTPKLLQKNYIKK